MIIKNLKNIVCPVFLFSLLIFLGCDKQTNQGTGFLEGKISIGPICPVETIPPDPACLPTAETYKAYPVIIWSSDGKSKIAQLSPALDGTYKTELNSGSYLITMGNGTSHPSGSNLPVEVSIVSQANTILNINVDTGIR